MTVRNQTRIESVAGNMDSKAILKTIEKDNGKATLATVAGGTMTATMDGGTLVLTDEKRVRVVSDDQRRQTIKRRDPRS